MGIRRNENKPKNLLRLTYQVNSAAGLGTLNHREEIQKVIDQAARAGGGLIQLGQGAYHLDRGLRLYENITLSGIKPPEDMSSPLETTLLLDRFDLSDSNTINDLASGDAGKNYFGNVVYSLDCSNVRVQYLNINGCCKQKISQISNFIKLKGDYYTDLFSGIKLMSATPQNVLTETDIPPRESFAKDCSVHRCTITNCYTNGVHMVNIHRPVVTDTVSNNNGYLEHENTAEATRNIPGTGLMHFDSFGICFDQYCSNGTIDNCRIFGNHHGGIELTSMKYDTFLIKGCKADSIVLQCWAGPLDLKRNSIKATIECCELDNTAMPRRMNPIDNLLTVDNSVSDVLIKDCKFKTAYNSAIKCTGYYTNVNGIVTNIYPTKNITIEKCDIFCVQPASSSYERKPIATRAIQITEAVNVSISKCYVEGAFLESAIQCDGVEKLSIVSNNFIKGSDQTRKPKFLISYRHISDVHIIDNVLSGYGLPLFKTIELYNIAPTTNRAAVISTWETRGNKLS